MKIGDVAKNLGAYLPHIEHERSLRTWRLRTTVQIWFRSSIHLYILSTGAIRVPGPEWWKAERDERSGCNNFSRHAASNTSSRLAIAERLQCSPTPTPIPTPTIECLWLLVIVSLLFSIVWVDWLKSFNKLTILFFAVQTRKCPSSTSPSLKPRENLFLHSVRTSSYYGKSICYCK